MGNNENEFKNDLENDNMSSSDPFGAIDNGAYTQSDDPFATIENNAYTQSSDPFASSQSDNTYTQSDMNYGADNGYTRVNNNGAYFEPAPETQGFAIASMTLGIIYLVCCCLGNISLIMAIVSIVFGIIALVKKAPGKGMAIAGIICSGLAVLIYIAAAIIVIAVGKSISPADLQEFEQLIKELERAQYQ